MDISNWDNLPLLYVRHPSTDLQWNQAIRRYLDSSNDTPLLRCIEVAREAGARTLVVETAYIDADYRSEYGSYFAHQFRHRPDTAHRLHFFSRRLDIGEIGRGPGSTSYLGYVVLRPCETGPVSRAMLQPPPSLADAIRTAVSDSVNLCGTDLVVTGVPFSQQDAQLGSCAHASAWMCHYTAALRGDTTRRTTGHIAESVDSKLSEYRRVPTQGLMAVQLSELFRSLEQPAHYYDVESLPESRLPWEPPESEALPGNAAVQPKTCDDPFIPIVSHFLNSGLPVLVGTHNHAFVLCGYERITDGEACRIEFVRHDDQLGPYLRLDDVRTDADPANENDDESWSTIFIPAPEKLWLAPEQAEWDGGLSLYRLATRLSASILGESSNPLSNVLSDERFALHTYAVKSNRFKTGLSARRMPDDIATAYCLAALPRYVWVVEAVDRRLQDDGKPCVLGEALYDATSSRYRPEMLTIHVAGAMLIDRSVRSMSQSPVYSRTDAAPYESGGIGAA